MSSESALERLKQSQQALNDAVDTASTAIPEPNQPWTPDLVQFLSSSMLIFTALTLLLCTALLWRKNAEAYEVLKLFGIISIIGLSAVLLVTGFSNEQLTPIVGLFGAISGYLLGKESKNTNSEEKN